jgi:hypothetical protein
MYFRQFIECHEGLVNRLIHVIGFALIGLGIIEKNIWLVVSGGVIQELGHFYEYGRTRDPKSSPWFCLKPQLLFAYPLFVLVVLYVLLAR